MTSPLLTLNDGHQMPQLGFGLVQVPAPTTSDTVAAALRLCYRMCDGAAPYGNEGGHGRGVRARGLPGDGVWRVGE